MCLTISNEHWKQYQRRLRKGKLLVLFSVIIIITLFLYNYTNTTLTIIIIIIISSNSLKAKANDDADDNMKLFAGLVEGIAAVEKGMQKTFNQFGVVKYGAAGDTVSDSSAHFLLSYLLTWLQSYDEYTNTTSTSYSFSTHVVRSRDP
jgi:hypothetical protein